MIEEMLRYADAARETARRFAELGGATGYSADRRVSDKKGKNKHVKRKNCMAKREKKIILSGVTREAMEEAFGRYATADAEMQSINAAMDKEFVAIRERNAERLAELEQQKTESFEVMQVFATEQREVLFSKRRSLETTHGIIGFRTGTPKLKTRRGFTWAAALELVREFLPSYIRTSEEVAKDKLLADRENEQLQPLMQKCGIDVVQEESFYVEPKKEKED